MTDIKPVNDSGVEALVIVAFDDGNIVSKRVLRFRWGNVETDLAWTVRHSSLPLDYRFSGLFLMLVGRVLDHFGIRFTEAPILMLVFARIPMQWRTCRCRATLFGINEYLAKTGVFIAFAVIPFWVGRVPVLQFQNHQPSGLRGKSTTAIWNLSAAHISVRKPVMP